jgi:hypothetical protein
LLHLDWDQGSPTPQNRFYHVCSGIHIGSNPVEAGGLWWRFNPENQCRFWVMGQTPTRKNAKECREFQQYVGYGLNRCAFCLKASAQENATPLWTKLVAHFWATPIF